MKEDKPRSEDATFNKLLAVDIKGSLAKKQNLTYLAWADAWRYVKRDFPSATYEVKKFDNLPYVYDHGIGFMVYTSVTIKGETLEMWLPVMDGANNAMKKDRYSYKVKEYKNRQPTGGFIDKWVEPATMFDINKTIMRCLTKNLSMFGLGLELYSKDDLPSELYVEIVDPVKANELRNIAVSKNNAEEVIKMLSRYGVKNFPQLPASDYDEVKSALNKIEVIPNEKV